MNTISDGRYSFSPYLFSQMYCGMYPQSSNNILALMLNEPSFLSEAIAILPNDSAISTSLKYQARNLLAVT